MADEEPDAWVRLLRVHAVLSREMDRRLELAHGLPLGAYEILIALLDAPERRLRRVDLAQRLLITQSGVTRRLQGLEQRGLVDRAPCEEDGRVTYARLTAAGVDLVRAARKTHRADIAELFTAHFTARQLERLAELLARVPGAVADDWAPVPRG